MRLPSYKQLRHYWVVSQGDGDLPCAMFLLESDAREWVDIQESKDMYKVIPPLAK